jgi:hypothetical protein
MSDEHKIAKAAQVIELLNGLTCSEALGVLSDAKTILLSTYFSMKTVNTQDADFIRTITPAC